MACMIRTKRLVYGALVVFAVLTILSFTLPFIGTHSGHAVVTQLSP
jgi:hypothetical protein